MITRIVLTFMILCGSYPLTAQQALIKGLIKDKSSGNPVAGATVYVNNSTYTRICEASGAFVFDKYPALPFELTVSAVGYETGLLKVSADNAGQQLQLALQPRIVNLGEVNVSAPERDGWAKYGQRFTEELIGYSGFAAQCKLMNKEAVQFRFDPDAGILKAWSEQPLQIRNKATGYDITYWLEDFELDMFKNKLYYRGYAYFREMPASGKTARRIEANRKAAFNGSFYHFVRALYKGRPLEEGFEIRVLKRMPEDKIGRYIPLSADTLAWTDTARFRQLFEDIYRGSPLATQLVSKASEVLQTWRLDALRTAPLRLKGRADPQDSTVFPLYVFVKREMDKDKVVVKHYEQGGAGTGNDDPRVLNPKKTLTVNVQIQGLPQNFKPPLRTLEVLFTALIPVDSIVRRSTVPADVLLKFEDCLQVTYTREKEEMAYLQKKAGAFRKPAAPDVQVSVISLNTKEGIHLQEDGNFYEAYDLLLEQYWSFEKLDKLMPLDYKP